RLGVSRSPTPSWPPRRSSVAGHFETLCRLADHRWIRPAAAAVAVAGGRDEARRRIVADSGPGDDVPMLDRDQRRDRPSCNAVRQRWTYGAAFVRTVMVSDASWAVPVAYVARAASR